MQDFLMATIRKPYSLLKSLPWGWLSWVFWILVGVVLPVGIGYRALREIVYLPADPDCQLYDGSQISPAERLHCAKLLAFQHNVSDLRRAIHLAQDLPVDHPLRPQSDRLIDRWSLSLLDLADASFQSGDLEGAIQVAEYIPLRPTIQSAVQRRVSHWRTVWLEAETLVSEIEKAIAQEQWDKAFSQTRALQDVPNQYWAIIKAGELLEQIQMASGYGNWQLTREDRLDRLNSLRFTGLRERLQQQRQQQEGGQSITYLQRALQLAETGDVDSLRSAIAEADRVNVSSPQYQEAQQLIQSWQERVETLRDQPYLDRATELARSGDTDSLRAAIEEANRIRVQSPLYQQAQDRIHRWYQQIQQAPAPDRRQPDAGFIEPPGKQSPASETPRPN